MESSLLLTHSEVGRNLLNGKHLLIGALNLKPFVMYTNVSQNGEIHDIDGFIYQIVLYMAAKYQFSFAYSIPPDKAYGAIVNNTWNGLIGQLARKELDLGAACMLVTYPRCSVTDCSVQYYDDPVSLVIPYPTIDSTINGIIRPFQYDVWIYMTASLFAMVFALWILLKIKLAIFDKERVINRPTLYESFWSLLDFGFVNSEIPNSSRLSIKVLATTLCLMSFVVVNAYSSTLTAYLMTPRYHPMVDSIEDIIKIPRPIFMVTKSSAYESTFLNAKEGALSKIGDSLRKYPELRIVSNSTAKSTANIMQWVIDYRRTFTSVRSFLLSTMEVDYKTTGQCRLYLAKQPWDTARIAFNFQKNSPLTPVFNRQIIWLRDVGLLDYWSRRYWSLMNKCSEPLPTSLGNQVALNLDALSSHFILLGCGIFGSSIVFVIERVLHIYRASKRYAM